MPRPPRSNSFTRHTAIELRKEPTPAETSLWFRLRRDQLGVSFRRQHAIGPYIVDFCCLSKRLIIELDGGPHLEMKAYDSGRTEFLVANGYKVLRFWNSAVLERPIEVLAQVRAELDQLG